MSSSMPECTKTVKRSRSHHPSMTQSVRMDAPSTSASLSNGSRRSTHDEKHGVRDMGSTVDLDLMRIPPEAIDRINTTRLGKGTYGHVEKCKYRPPGGEWRAVAIKFMNEPQDRENLRKEAKIMFGLRGHAHCIELFGLFECPTDGLGVVMEYMDCKSMAELLANKSISYTMDHAASWLHQLATAVDYFHSKKELHRDLKVQNLLLQNRYRHLKVCDFGTFTPQRDTMQSTRGTPMTMAPEVFRMQVYTTKCDIYSCGIIMWQIIARRDPYDRTLSNYNVLLWNVAESGKRPPELDCSPLLSRFYKRCWHNDPHIRPDSKELLEYFSILKKVYPKGDEALLDVVAHEPARTPQPIGSLAPSMLSSVSGANGVSRHRRAGSDQSTLISMVNTALEQGGSSSTATDLHPNRSHSLAGLTRLVTPCRSSTTTPTPTDPISILEYIDKELKPLQPIIGNELSEAKYNEHVAGCHQLYDMEQALRKQLELKHAVVSRLADAELYKRLEERKKSLLQLRHDALKNVQQRL